MHNLRSDRYSNPATTHRVQALDAALGMLRSGRITPKQLVVLLLIAFYADRAGAEPRRAGGVPLAGMERGAARRPKAIPDGNHGDNSSSASGAF